MSNVKSDFTLLEKELDLAQSDVTLEDLERMRVMFNNIPHKPSKMSAEDISELRRLLPTLDIDQVKDCEVKSVTGTCVCGRAMTLLDVVRAALSESKHSAKFLEEIFNGTKGRYVVVGYRLPENVTSEFRKSMPPNTIFVQDVAPIPCKDCGREQEIILFQKNILHFWVQ